MLSQKVLICLYVLTIINIALDVWLEEHFAKTARDIEMEFQAPENTLQIPEIIHVTSEHPIYYFRQSDLVALVSRDDDPFWLTEVTNVSENSLEVGYFHHSFYKPGKKLVWKKHNSKGTCGLNDVYARFKTEEQLFTKGKTIRKKALKKVLSSLFDL
jgi:hypothetical protein